MPWSKALAQIRPWPNSIGSTACPRKKPSPPKRDARARAARLAAFKGAENGDRSPHRRAQSTFGFKAVAKAKNLPMMICRHGVNGWQGCACRSNGAGFDGVSFVQAGQLPPTIHAGLHPVRDPCGTPMDAENRSAQCQKSPGMRSNSIRKPARRETLAGGQLHNSLPAGQKPETARPHRFPCPNSRRRSEVARWSRR